MIGCLTRLECCGGGIQVLWVRTGREDEEGELPMM